MFLFIENTRKREEENCSKKKKKFFKLETERFLCKWYCVVFADLFAVVSFLDVAVQMFKNKQVKKEGPVLPCIAAFYRLPLR